MHRSLSQWYRWDAAIKGVYYEPLNMNFGLVLDMERFIYVHVWCTLFPETKVDIVCKRIDRSLAQGHRRKAAVKGFNLNPWR
jgi:hypothetical protein